eukprot:2710388-Prymnesium_polylepis.2
MPRWRASRGRHRPRCRGSTQSVAAQMMQLAAAKWGAAAVVAGLPEGTRRADRQHAEAGVEGAGVAAGVERPPP